MICSYLITNYHIAILLLILKEIKLLVSLCNYFTCKLVWTHRYRYKYPFFVWKYITFIDVDCSATHMYQERCCWLLYPSVLLQCVGATMDVELLGYTTTVQDTRLLLLKVLWTACMYDYSPCPEPSCCCCCNSHRPWWSSGLLLLNAMRLVSSIGGTRLLLVPECLASGGALVPPGRVTIANYS